ncbi:hypothetical protein [Pseudorhodoferax sp. Leaf267]|nr:hypothetical protein [Pseudorhodoferax sp. Leaf267]
MARTSTCGTSTSWVLASASITVCSISQTVSLVNWAICAALSAMPGRNW